MPGSRTPAPIRKFRLPPLGTTSGSALLWRPEEGGWSHPPLFLSTPLLILRVNSQGTSVETPFGAVIATHQDQSVTPFRWIDEILAVLAEAAAGTERKLFASPSFPMALFCASYEAGRFFNPHEHCFPHAADSEVDDLYVAFHCTGFVRRDNQWAVVGRPPSRNVKWRDWQPAPEMAEWPRPPGFHEAASSDRIRSLTGMALEYKPAVPAMTRDEYDAAFHRIRGHLTAGDIYQANLTTRFEGHAPCSPERIFARGVANGGSRYAALVRGPGYYHISFSPELLVKKWGRSITTRPIKGTRPRPDDDNDLPAVVRELNHSAKDRAEHIMIVDLERNDLGRLCEYGTIRVDPLMEPTVHPTVVHLESTVTGTLRPNIGLREIIAATFPGGSVTGAPKRRALEIIGEIENRPRGIYCGALGWIDHRGDCELNLPIRTATMYDDYRLHYYAGGGIVYDSQPVLEWEELHQKVAFLEDAIRAAINV